LLAGEGYAPSFKELMEDTEWERYGTGRNPKCDNCMDHSDYEGTAVNDTFAHPLKAMRAWWRGPRTDGPMAPELPVRYSRESADAARMPSQVRLSAKIPVRDRHGEARRSA